MTHKIELVYFLNNYCIHGNQLHIRVPVISGGHQFEMILCKGDRVGGWNEDYMEWLESLRLVVDKVFGGADQLMITTEPVKLRNVLPD